MSVCKLCEQVKPLISTSHIIPDWMYNRLYTGNHKLHKFQPSKFVSGEKHIVMPSNSEYEGGLLCGKCDNNIIGLLENYGKTFLKEKGYSKKKCHDY